MVMEDGGRSRGFGFVEFEDEESLKKALFKLNGISLMGRNINLKHDPRGGGRCVPSWGTAVRVPSPIVRPHHCRVRDRLYAVLH